MHDLETNVGYVARARRRIELKRGRKAVDPDMIQIAGAAAISVARRNAILGCVPKPVWRKALEAVEAVMRGDQKTLIERRDGAIAYFNKAGVPTERILKSLEVGNLDDITLEHLLDLNGMRSALKTGESSLDQLFPVEREPGPAPQTLTDKLQMLSTVDPETGEIKESGAEAAASPTPGGAGAVVESPPGPTAPVSQRTRGSRRAQTTIERLQADGNAAAEKGKHKLYEWWDTLSGDEVAQITPEMDAAFRAKAALNEGLL